MSLLPEETVKPNLSLFSLHIKHVVFENLVSMSSLSLHDALTCSAGTRVMLDSVWVRDGVRAEFALIAAGSQGEVSELFIPSD